MSKTKRTFRSKLETLFSGASERILSMLSRLARGLLLLTPLAMVIGLTAAPSEAATRVGRVSGVHAFAPNWTAATLKLRWHAVKGASRYQVRMATDVRHLVAARGFVTKRTIVAPRVKRSTRYLVQVRAIRHRKKGAWSLPIVAP